MPQTRAVVGHNVKRAGNVVKGGMITVEALVQGLEAKEVGRRAVGSDRTLSLPGNSRGVVCTGMDSAFPNVDEGSISILLNDGPGELQIGVIDGAMRVGVRH
jgi:hypothetical protein